MTFDGRDWTLERHAPDFSPLDFHQRWLATFSAHGNTIQGRWETSPDGRDWELDFELTYVHPRTRGSRGRRCREAKRSRAAFALNCPTASASNSRSIRVSALLAVCSVLE